MRTVALFFATCAVVGGILFAAHAYTEHNPLLPGMRGCAQVRDSISQMDCYTDEVAEMSKDTDPFVLMRTLAEQAVDDVDLRANCHQALHQVGERAGEEAAKAGDERPEIDSSDNCMEGFGHGFAMGMDRESSADELRDAAGESCAPKQTMTTTLDCLHALGHSLLRKRDSIDDAIDDCVGIDYEALTIDEQVASIRTAYPKQWTTMVQEECNKGVYMEVSFGLSDTAKKNPVKASRELCRETVRDDVGLCVQYAPQVVRLVGGTEPQAIKACADYSGDNQRRCAFGLGITVNEVAACRALEDPALVQECRRAFELTGA